MALRGGALRGLVTRGTRTRCLLAIGAAAAAAYQTAFFAATARAGVAVGTVVTIGAAPVFTGILALATGQPSRPGARWLAATAAAVAGCAMLVIISGQDICDGPVSVCSAETKFDQAVKEGVFEVRLGPQVLRLQSVPYFMCYANSTTLRSKPSQ